MGVGWGLRVGIAVGEGMGEHYLAWAARPNCVRGCRRVQCCRVIVLGGPERPRRTIEGWGRTVVLLCI